jgi:carboxylesterase
VIRARYRWLLLFDLLFVALWIVFGHVRGLHTVVQSHPAMQYEDALEGLARLRARDDSTVNPDCHTILWTHGRKVERAVVLLHGFTNCPKQFAPLGAELYQRGWNVLIPRIPRQGLANVMTSDLAGLTAEELVASGEEAVDIAHGLGDRVTVVGLSSSAVVAAYLAQHRSDIDEAVLIAPALAPKGMPDFAARRVTNVLLTIPNFFVWWDPGKKAANPGPKQCYPRFPSHGLAQVYRLGFLTSAEAARDKPRARSIVIVTTGSDEGVNNASVIALGHRWKTQGVDLRSYEFPAYLGIHHDMIDPEQPYQRVADVYPALLREIDPEAAASRTVTVPAGGSVTAAPDTGQSRR